MAAFLRPFIVLVVSSLLMSSAFVVGRATEQQHGSDEKKRVTSLHLEIVTPHEDAELKDFTSRFTKEIWSNWWAVMPQDVQLGAAGIVVVRFQVEKDRSRRVEPIIERDPGQKLKSLTKAALTTIQRSIKSTHLPDSYGHQSVELRATFRYNQPEDSVQKLVTN